MEKIDYQISDITCSKLLNEFNAFPEFEEMHAWLDLHKPLYDKINIEPKGLPAIANCNYDGVRYEHIAKFHSLYKKTEYEYNLLDHMSHLEVLVYFIERMDAIMIHQYLPEKEYMGMGFRDFNYKISCAIQELYAHRGNRSLRTEAVSCNRCNQKQYYFIGDYDESYMHLILKVENGAVNDFIECRESKCNIPFYLDPEKQVWVDTITPPF